MGREQGAGEVVVDWLLAPSVIILVFSFSLGLIGMSFFLDFFSHFSSLVMWSNIFSFLKLLTWAGFIKGSKVNDEDDGDGWDGDSDYDGDESGMEVKDVI